MAINLTLTFQSSFDKACCSDMNKSMYNYYKSSIQFSGSLLYYLRFDCEHNVNVGRWISFTFLIFKSTIDDCRDGKDGGGSPVLYAPRMACFLN